MIQLIVLIIFILSLGIITAGILISSHLRSTYQTNFMSTVIFFQVFWFTYGFYVFWGQVVVTMFLAPYVEQSLLIKINNIAFFLGSPFLIFACFMAVRFSKEITGKKNTGTFITIYLTINALIFPGVGFVLNKYHIIEAHNLVKYAFIPITLLCSLMNVYYLFTLKKKLLILKNSDTKIIISGLIFLMLFQSSSILIYDRNIYFTLCFILVFYLTGTFLPVYLRYIADLSKILILKGMNLSFDSFCKNFEISKREKEIIIEICNGYSNQQIADKLFISLQTVKDHTHRIYSKTNCNSRTQLIRMVSENSR